MKKIRFDNFPPLWPTLGTSDAFLDPRFMKFPKERVAYDINTTRVIGNGCYDFELLFGGEHSICHALTSEIRHRLPETNKPIWGAHKHLVNPTSHNKFTKLFLYVFSKIEIISLCIFKNRNIIIDYMLNSLFYAF